MAAQRWRDTGTCSIGADGTGTATIAPLAGGSYRIRFTSVRVTPPGASRPSTADLYRDDVSDLNWIEGTESGDKDSSDTVFEIITPETIVMHWSNATPGATAQFRCEGFFSVDGSF